MLLFIYFTLFTLSEKKTNSNCCNAALAVYLLLFSASYYLHHGECEARAYNAGLGAEPPAGSKGRAPGHRVRGLRRLKLKAFWLLDVQRSRQI